MQNMKVHCFMDVKKLTRNLWISIFDLPECWDFTKVTLLQIIPLAVVWYQTVSNHILVSNILEPFSNIIFMKLVAENLFMKDMRTICSPCLSLRSVTGWYTCANWISKVIMPVSAAVNRQMCFCRDESASFLAVCTQLSSDIVDATWV